MPADAVRDFLSYVSVERGLSVNTRQAYERDLKEFSNFCIAKKIKPLKASLNDLRSFLAFLRKRELSQRSLARKTSAVKQFYKFLLREDRVKVDPSELLSVTLKPRKLPKVLTPEEMRALVESPHGAGDISIRDRAMLEMWYATGCRISELLNLRIDDIDFKGAWVKFMGKGRRQRAVPIHKRCLDWILKYRDVRHEWLRETGLKEDAIFFLSRQGLPFSRQGMWKIVKKYAKAAGLTRRVYPHMIRHSFATHVLHGGADLRAVQELLGHRSITTTEIYTHLDTENLRQMQIKYHPRS